MKVLNYLRACAPATDPMAKCCHSWTSCPSKTTQFRIVSCTIGLGASTRVRGQLLLHCCLLPLLRSTAPCGGSLLCGSFRAGVLRGGFSPKKTIDSAWQPPYLPPLPALNKRNFMAVLRDKGRQSDRPEMHFEH
jgi:hypothetical protein